MHLVDIEHGFMGATGVVGGNLPLALGTALAQHLQGTDQVTVVFFGDGAVQAGHFNESINLAALWKLPVIFVCENNGFAEFTSRAEHIDGRAGQRRGRAVRVRARDGRGQRRRRRSTTAFANFLEQARGGEGPYLLECLTFRRRGHYEGDPEKYRDPDAEREWAARDPIARFDALVRRRTTRRDEIEREAGEEIEAAVRFARDSPFPDPTIAADARLRDMIETETTFVEAIATTLARAMRDDERVIVLGEDVAEGGPYLATAGLAEEFGARARAQHADQRGRGLRRRDRRRPVGPAAGRRDHVHRLHHARARPARQPGGEGALHVRRPAVGAARAPHPGRCRPAQRRPALAEPRGVADARARA